MKNILLIYRGQVFETEVEPKLEQYKNDNITLVVESIQTKHIISFLITNYKQKINIITIQEFLKETFNMKFKKILGNPPYQNTQSDSDAAKLYIDITKKVLTLLDDDGEIDFLTPDTIVRDGRNKFTVKQQGLRSVDYTANEDFNEGVTIINWVFDKKYKKDEVNVTNIDGSVDIRKYSNSLVDKTDLLVVNLFEKLKLEKSKLFTLDQSARDRNSSSENKKYKIFSNINKNKIVYTNIKPKLYGKRKLIISLSSSYKPELLYNSTDDFGELHVMIDITNYTDIQINNIKKFLFNPICVNICNLYKKIYKKGFNSMLYVFPEIDVDKKYTNSDVIRLFKLTKNEVNILLNESK